MSLVSNTDTGKHQLNTHLIPRHVSLSYTYRAHVSKKSAGQYKLAVVFTNGRTVMMSAR